MTTAELAAKLIRVFEGCRLRAYRDSGGILTVGFGHTGPDVTEGLVITYEHAVELFAADIHPLLKMVEGMPPLKGAALVSFGYNCGASALKRLLAGEIKFSDRVRDRKGNVLPGLVARRELEQALVEAVT